MTQFSKSVLSITLATAATRSNTAFITPPGGQTVFKEVGVVEQYVIARTAAFLPERSLRHKGPSGVMPDRLNSVFSSSGQRAVYKMRMSNTDDAFADDSPWDAVPSDSSFGNFDQDGFLNNYLDGIAKRESAGRHVNRPGGTKPPTRASDNNHDLGKGLPHIFDKKVIDVLLNTKAEDPDGEISSAHLLANLLDGKYDAILDEVGVTATAIRRVVGLKDPEPRISSDLKNIYQSRPPNRKAPNQQRYDTEKLVESFTEELSVILSTLESTASNPLGEIEIRDAIIGWANNHKDSNIGFVVNGAIRVSQLLTKPGGLDLGRVMPYRPEERHYIGRGADPESEIRKAGSNAPNRLDSPSVSEWRAAKSAAKSTKTIDELCEDLTQLAADGQIDSLVGRDKEINQVAIAMQTMKKTGALVVGPPGTGKTALIEALANRVVAGELPGLKNYRIVALPVSNLVAGANLRGSLEEKVKAVIKEAKNQPIILFMDEFHTIIGAGKAQGESSDLADMFKSARGVKIIGCTTEKEYTEKFKSDPAFERRFELIKFPEPDRKATKHILNSLIPKLSAHHGVTYEDGAIDTAINLAKRFVAGYSPDKEITILDRAGAQANHHNISIVDADAILAGVEESTGVPLARIESGGGRSPSEIAAALKARVIGQDDAIDAATTAIFQARTGVNPNRPSVIVFSGPTGTGKTELAKAIADVDGRTLIRIDMSTVKTINALRGAEPGYIGYERDGLLTGPQKLHPYSLVLLDEIEKAPDDVLKGLLGLLDDGMLTDGRGERVLYNNAIIIFTTNFGAHDGLGGKGSVGFDLGIDTVSRDDKKSRTDDVKHRLGERLGPEYINRFRNFVLFDELSKETTLAITVKNLKDIGKEIGEAKNLKFHYHPRLSAAIAAEGYDPKYGAREVRRICDSLIRSCVGRLLLEHPELGKTDKEYSLAFTLGEDRHLHIGIKGMGSEIVYERMAVSPDLRQIDIR